MCMVTCVIITITSLMTNFSERKLTYRAWVPFEYSSMTLYCILYIHQLIGLTMGALVNVACDSLICGLLVHVCCQYEILTYRLNRIMFHSDGLRNCVQQHCKIFRLAFITYIYFYSLLIFGFNKNKFPILYYR